ncbi:protein SOSEKI 5-like [Bidens hawaiensis]|uniref:protein SOSEKI 5-like n=1 Tax=Bidens hawaiensis TaxID=980011 RepID=UPI00404931DE
MATDSRNEIFISRRLKKTRNRINNLNPLMLSTPDASPNFITPRTSPAVAITPRKVPVLYYLTRNGHIEHPHLIDVPRSSVDGLYLRDVMNTLNYHRGKGMANMYSWSCKRSYKNGYVWHDLSEDDLIDVTNSHDYVLKGAELLQPHPTDCTDTNRTGENCTSSSTAAIRRRNQSWSSFDNPQEYMVVKCESNRELAANFAADAATQTEEQRKGHVAVAVVTEEMPSPPPSNSSSDGVSGGRYGGGGDGDRTVEDKCDGSGRMKASEMLMQLITCGAPASRLKMQTGCG